jgi:hypothetical protein
LIDGITDLLGICYLKTATTAKVNDGRPRLGSWDSLKVEAEIFCLGLVAISFGLFSVQNSNSRVEEIFPAQRYTAWI